MPQETYVSPLQRALIVSGWRCVDPGWACHQGGGEGGGTLWSSLERLPGRQGDGKKKWPFLGNTDGLGTSLSFYFKRIKSEPDLQSETCGKSPELREPAAPEGGEASCPGWLIRAHFPHALPQLLHTSHLSSRPPTPSLSRASPECLRFSPSSLSVLCLSCR